MKEFGIGPDGVSSNSGIYYMFAIGQNVIINQPFELIKKQLKLEFLQDINILESLYWMSKLH